MNAITEKLYSTFDESCIDNYNKTIVMVKNYEKMIDNLCNFLYEKLMASEFYSRYLLLNISQDIVVAVPEELNKTGIESIKFNGHGFEICYALYSLNIDPDIMYEGLNEYVRHLNIVDYKLENKRVFSVPYAEVDEFYFETYLLIGLPHINFNESALVKVKHSNFMVLDYLKMNLPTYYCFLKFCHLDVSRNNIVVYLDSFVDSWELLFKSYVHLDGILYYCRSDSADSILDTLTVLDHVKHRIGSSLNIVYGSRFKDIFRTWFSIKRFSVLYNIKKLALYNINIRFLDTLERK